MGITIDHLSVDHLISVIQDFTDARGAYHGVGEQGRIRELGFDGLTRMITVRWEREGQDDTMWFALASTTGPGNGRMREYFALGEYVRPDIEGKRWIPGVGHVPVMPDIPPVRNDVVRSYARYGDAMERVWALAARQRFDEAEEQVIAMLNAKDRRGDLCAPVASDLCAHARTHAFDLDLTVHHWLRERGISLWYAWGAQASSGGEGAARATDIRAAERAFLDLDRKLGR
ncbi:hypothetical protein [Gemmatimonas groenlandica]|uniref:Uncharacterized protein n=1 Tax=Gemmatimonas groenlandica TaxID=2732249 RepID=A0A6M4ITI8_9BACT|nr:hypothetical protein [Gemmatimonas groenlandica]QJR37535.1 hypothetical protein HKW67_19455 [Gemmatimonas groenlandica]